MASIEAILLTGGASRRMGRDKAKLLVGGVPQAERIVHQFLDAGIPVTVLGREAIQGAAFVRDKQDFGGPIAALSAFQPTAKYVFVASCDLPSFDVRLVEFLHANLDASEALACAPKVDGFRQPLCALYRKETFAKLANLEDQCAMGWLNALPAVIVEENDLAAAGLKAAAARGANTPEELAAATGEN